MDSRYDSCVLGGDVVIMNSLVNSLLQLTHFVVIDGRAYGSLYIYELVTNNDSLRIIFVCFVAVYDVNTNIAKSNLRKMQNKVNIF